MAKISLLSCGPRLLRLSQAATPLARPAPISQGHLLMPSKPPVHRPKGWRSDQERKAELDQRRGSSSKRGYGADWRALRNDHIARHPLCSHCEAEGRITLATDVDHIIAHKGNDALRLDPNNLQSLCKRHHSKKTATEDSRFARKKATRSGDRIR